MFYIYVFDSIFHVQIIKYGGISLSEIEKSLLYDIEHDISWRLILTVPAPKTYAILTEDVLSRLIWTPAFSINTDNEECLAIAELTPII